MDKSKVSEEGKEGTESGLPSFVLHNENGSQKEVRTPTAAPGLKSHDATFFDGTNVEAKTVREQLAIDTLDEIVGWLRTGGKVAIHDATNSTVARRKALMQRVEKEHGIQAFFIESICPDPKVLQKNIEMKLSGPDYLNMDPAQALDDFRARIANYEKVYETISEEEERNNVSYIKIIDVGRKVISHRIQYFNLIKVF